MRTINAFFLNQFETLKARPQDVNIWLCLHYDYDHFECSVMIAPSDDDNDE